MTFGGGLDKVDSYTKNEQRKLCVDDIVNLKRTVKLMSLLIPCAGHHLENCR